jgi:5-methylcytosine-specific restriction enzyme subunit McrC
LELVYLYENRYIDKQLASYDVLVEHIKQTPKLHTYFDMDFKGIKPKNYCGFLSIDNQNYFIIPKITDKNDQNLNTFIYMLIYAYDIKLKNEDLMEATNQEHHIYELFIWLFSDALLDEFKKGVFKKYITMQENLKVLRGKYIIEKNFNNFYHQNLYCEFDEFSMDNELNRFFLYAIRTFKKFSNYSNLHKCEAILDEVVYLNIDFKRRNLQFDRMNSRYKKSYEVALMILQKLIPMTQKSTNKSFAFLFDMAEVFEGFVGRLYKEIDSSNILQGERNYGSFKLKPDIVTSQKIIDTKYKKVNDRSSLSVQDKYQMFVYGKNYEYLDVMLLYPRHLENLSDNLKLGKGEGLIRLEMRSLDLDYIGGYSEYINEMRKRLESIDGR